MKKFFVIDNQSSKAKKLVNKLLNLKPNDWVLNNKDFEYLFIVGGDGTFLRNAHKYDNKKVIAINGGSFGYFAYFNATNIKYIFKMINNNKSFFNPLQIEVSDLKNTFFCLNEVYIRSDKVFKAKIFFNNKLLQNYKGTGLLISTPLGSTAHAKNVGGAIIDPNLKVMQLIEIESLTQKQYHSLNAPFVFDIYQKITLKISDDTNFNTIIDGMIQESKLDKNITITFKPASFLLFNPDYQNNYIKKLRDSFIKDR